MPKQTPGYSMAHLSTENPSVDTSKFIKDYQRKKNLNFVKTAVKNRGSG